MYCFEHIPKTAGVSVCSALQLEYKDSYVRLKKDRVNELSGSIRCVSGHRCVRTLAKSSLQGEMITLLRDPVSLVESHFNHISKNVRTRHFYNIRVLKKTLSD